MLWHIKHLFCQQLKIFNLQMRFYFSRILVGLIIFSGIEFSFLYINNNNRTLIKSHELEINSINFFRRNLLYTHHFPKTLSPFIQVPKIFVLKIWALSVFIRSLSSIIKSAAFPFSKLPFSFSSKAALAAQIVMP